MATPVKEIPWATLGGDAVRAVLDAAPVGMLITDADERIRWLNRTLRRELDVSWPEVLGEGLETLPLERVEDFVGGRERYRVLSGIPGDDDMMDASVSILDVDAEGPLKVRYFLRHEGKGLRASLLKYLGARRGRDLLSGVMDKDAIMRVLDGEISRARRYDNELSIVLIEVRPEVPGTDPDLVVASAGQLLSDGLRWVDAVGRIGDMEFLLVLPETDADGVKVLAEKLRQRFEAPPDDHPRLDPGLSSATWREGDDSKFMLDRAREGLKKRKKAS